MINNSACNHFLLSLKMVWSTNSRIHYVLSFYENPGADPGIEDAKVNEAAFLQEK
jgi:hypothetical protein